MARIPIWPTVALQKFSPRFVNLFDDGISEVVHWSSPSNSYGVQIIGDAQNGYAIKKLQSLLGQCRMAFSSFIDDGSRRKQIEVSSPGGPPTASQFLVRGNLQVVSI